MMNSNLSIFLTGSAKFKKNTTEGIVFDYATIAVEVDLVTEKIIAVECTLCSHSEEKFIGRLLENKHLTDDGFEKIYKEINYRFNGINKMALVTALRNLKCNWDDHFIELTGAENF